MNPTNIENLSSCAGNQTAAGGNQPLNNDLQSIKQTVLKDIQVIENLVQTGAMTQEQGQNLMNYVTKKAFEKYTLCQQGQTPQGAQQQPVAANLNAHVLWAVHAHAALFFQSRNAGFAKRFP